MPQGLAPVVTRAATYAGSRVVADPAPAFGSSADPPLSAPPHPARTRGSVAMATVQRRMKAFTTNLKFLVKGTDTSLPTRNLTRVKMPYRGPFLLLFATGRQLSTLL